MSEIPTQREGILMQLAYWRERQVVNERALQVAAVEVGKLATMLEQLDGHLEDNGARTTPPAPAPQAHPAP